MRLTTSPTPAVTSRALPRTSSPRYGGECSQTTMLARGSRCNCFAFTSPPLVTTWKLPSRHSCQTGDSSTVPSRRYVARTASKGNSARSPISSTVRFLRMPEGYRRVDLLTRGLLASYPWSVPRMPQQRAGEPGLVVCRIRLRATRHIDRASVPGVQDTGRSRAVMHQVDLGLAGGRIRTPLRHVHVPAAQERLVRPDPL